jgi:hypothetical protein
MWWRFLDSVRDFVPFSDVAREVYGSHEGNVYLAACLLPPDFNDHLWVESDDNPRLTWTRDALQAYIDVAVERGIFDVSHLTRNTYTEVCLPPL